MWRNLLSAFRRGPPKVTAAYLLVFNPWKPATFWACPHLHHWWLGYCSTLVCRVDQQRDLHTSRLIFLRFHLLIHQGTALAVLPHFSKIQLFLKPVQRSLNFAVPACSQLHCRVAGSDFPARGAQGQDRALFLDLNFCCACL